MNLVSSTVSSLNTQMNINCATTLQAVNWGARFVTATSIVTPFLAISAGIMYGACQQLGFRKTCIAMTDHLVSSLKILKPCMHALDALNIAKPMIGYLQTGRFEFSPASVITALAEIQHLWSLPCSSRSNTDILSSLREENNKYFALVKFFLSHNLYNAMMALWCHYVSENVSENELLHYTKNTQIEVNKSIELTHRLCETLEPSIWMYRIGSYAWCDHFNRLPEDLKVSLNEELNKLPISYIRDWMAQVTNECRVRNGVSDEFARRVNIYANNGFWVLLAHSMPVTTGAESQPLSTITALEYEQLELADTKDIKNYFSPLSQEYPLSPVLTLYGRVYSCQELTQLIKTTGAMQCPCTRQPFEWSDVKRVVLPPLPPYEELNTMKVSQVEDAHKCATLKQPIIHVEPSDNKRTIYDYEELYVRYEQDTTGLPNPAYFYRPIKE